MNEEKLRGLLGLCQRAGKLQTGTDMALKAIQSGKCRLALLDALSAENTVKKISDACIYYHVPYRMLPAGLLSGACGKEGRMAAAVLDRGFARQLTLLCGEAE